MTEQSDQEQKYEQEIALFVEAIRLRKAEIDRLTSMNEVAREEVEKLLVERGSNWKDEEGYAMIVGESERTSYDTKALDELLISDPIQYGWLHEYRKKTTVRASLKIK